MKVLSDLIWQYEYVGLRGDKRYLVDITCIDLNMHRVLVYGQDSTIKNKELTSAYGEKFLFEPFGIMYVESQNTKFIVS